MSVFQNKDNKGNIIKTKDGKSWYFKVRIDNKQIKRGAYLTKHEAKEQESLFLLQEDKPVYKTFRLVALSYLEYLKKIKKYSTYQSAVYTYDKHISPYFDDMRISDISIQDVKKWHEEIDKLNFTLSYKNKIHAVAKLIMDYAIKNYGLSKNPFEIYGRFNEKNDKIHEDAKLRYITLEEFKQFISVVDEPLWNCFFTTAFYTGCRKSELFALKWCDIDFANNFIHINKTLGRNDGINPYPLTSTKTNKNRKIKMNRTLRESLQAYHEIVMRADFSNDLFVFGDVTPLARTTVDRYKHYYFEKSGVHEITMHEFRHSCVSLLVNEMLKQDSKQDISKILYSLSSRFGHTPEVMMRTYAHFYEDDIQDNIVDILDNL